MHLLFTLMPWLECGHRHQCLEAQWMCHEWVDSFRPKLLPLQIRSTASALCTRTHTHLNTHELQEFNAVDTDVRRQREAAAELVLRAEELREALWALCDAKMEAAEAERARVAADSFVPDHTNILGHYYAALTQVGWWTRRPCWGRIAAAAVAAAAALTFGAAA